MRLLILGLLFIMVLPAQADDKAWQSKISIGPLDTHIDWRDWSLTPEEAILQTIHLIDVLQTQTFRGEQCYSESNPMTKPFTGSNPSTARVIAWGLATAALYNYTYQFIENSNMPKWLQYGLKAAPIYVKYNTITRNYELGVRIGRQNTNQPWIDGKCYKLSEYERYGIER